MFQSSEKILVRYHVGLGGLGFSKDTGFQLQLYRENSSNSKTNFSLSVMPVRLFCKITNPSCLAIFFITSLKVRCYMQNLSDRYYL